MSKLEELINKLCPNGVEFKKLSEVCNSLKKGTLKTSDLNANGKYPVINSGRELYGFYDEYNNKNAITLAARGEYAGYISYFENEFWAGGLCYPYSSKNEEFITNKFLYYYLKKNENKIMENLVARGSIPALNKSDLDRFLVPVPPLEVQCEIVRILDNFTLLSAELSAELSARQKQYQFYLDSIYENIKENNVTLGSLGSLIRGKRFVHADRVDVGVPCMHYGELYTFYGVHAKKVKSHIREELRPKMRYANKNDVIIVGAGENRMDIGIGVAWEGDEDIAVHDACYTLKHKQNPKYISYFLRTSQYHNQIKKFVSEGKICSISAEGLKKAIIPIPSLEKQNKIVNILENFDKLCNDISEGLPAEIEARKKQYEYYRDKLLTFKELKS